MSGLAAEPSAPFLPGERGTLSFDGMSFAGLFVSGEARASVSPIAGLVIGGRATLERVDVTGFVRASAAAGNGTLEVAGGGTSLSLMDAPAAYLRLTLAEGSTGTVVAAGSLRWFAGPEDSLWLRGDVEEGLLWTQCAEVEWLMNGTAAVLGPVPASCSVFFRATPAGAAIDPDALAVPLADGRLAAETSVWGAGENANSSTFHFTDDGEVAPVTTAADRISLVVRLDEEGPRSIILYVDEIQFAPARGPSVDGRPMVEAATAAQALDSEIEGDDVGGAYAVLHGAGTTALVLTLPEGGLHLVEVPLASASPPPSGEGPQTIAVQPVTPEVAFPAIALAAGLAAAAGGALLFWRRPRP